MRKLLPLFATAILVLPVSVWSQQSDTAQGQHSSDTAPNRAVQVSKQDAEKTNTEAQPSATADAAQDPLAAAARRAKEQKKAATKPAKVFTNDDIPSTGTGASGGSSTGGKLASSDMTAAPGKPGANDEKTWRNRFATLRHKLDQDQEALGVMQRELGQLNVQYYSDPVKAMQQQYTRSDINDKTAQIDAKKKEIDADTQAISDAEDELHKAGGEPGWAR